MIVGSDYRVRSGGCSHQTDKAQDAVGVGAQEGLGPRADLRAVGAAQPSAPCILNIVLPTRGGCNKF